MANKKKLRFKKEKLTAAQKREVAAKVVEAQQAIADLEKEIRAEDLSPDIFTEEPALLNDAYQAQAVSPNTDDADFNTCAVCGDPKVAKGRAIERDQKAEMILTIRKIVTDFRLETDTKLAELSRKIEAQIKPIIVMTNSIAVVRGELTTRLASFEDKLSTTFGLDKEVDPELTSTSLFGESLADVTVSPRSEQPDVTWQSQGQELDAVLNNDPKPTESIFEGIESSLEADDEAQYRQ